MCYFYLHQGKPFLKHLELKTCGWHNDRHAENFHCRVWGKNQDSCFIMQELRSYVTPRRASSSYRLHVHTFIMHAPRWKVGPLQVCNTWLGVSEEKLDSPLAYSSKYIEITQGKFLSTDLSSLFKPQQRLNLKKLGANMVKSLNTIQHFCKSFYRKADQRGIAPPLQNGGCSCSAKK